MINVGQSFTVFRTLDNEKFTLYRFTQEEFNENILDPHMYLIEIHDTKGKPIPYKSSFIESFRDN